MAKRNGKGTTPDPGAMGQGVPPGPADGPQEPEAPVTNGRELQADVAGESSDTLTLYLRDVRRTELFTAEQEFETATRARAGDFGARQSMI